MTRPSRRDVVSSGKVSKKVKGSETSPQIRSGLKFLALDRDLYCYVAAHNSSFHDPVLEDLRAETERLGSISEMLISREQGAFLTLLVAALGARSAVEIGTFTGYSAICIARGLSAQARLCALTSMPIGPPSHAVIGSARA